MDTVDTETGGPNGQGGQKWGKGEDMGWTVNIKGHLRGSMEI